MGDKATDCLLPQSDEVERLDELELANIVELSAVVDVDELSTSEQSEIERIARNFEAAFEQYATSYRKTDDSLTAEERHYIESIDHMLQTFIDQ